MKQLCSLLLILISIISCTGEQTTVNAGGTLQMLSGSGKGTWKSSEKPTSVIHDGYSFAKNSIQDTSLLIGGYIRKIFQDKAGNLWFATYFNGAGRYGSASNCNSTKKSLTFFTTKEGLSGNTIRDISQDVQGNIWFATNNGVSKYNPAGKANGFTNYTVEDGLIDNEVWSILIDKSGIIWFGTNGGVCRFDPNLKSAGKAAFSAFPLPAADLSNFPNVYPAPKLVNCIFQDKSGIIWFGTNGGGLYSYYPSASQLQSAGLVANPILSLGDEKNNLTHFTENDGLCNNFINNIYEDSHGRLWVSSRFGGVSRINISKTNSSMKNKITFTTITNKNGLSNNFVWNVYEDKKGDFWFATAGNGVDKYDGTKFTNYSIAEGPGDTFVQTMLEDADGNFWFGTASGLSRYEINLPPVGKSGFVTYRKNDGF